MNRNGLIGGLSLAIFVLGISPVAAQTTLRYKFKEGDKQEFLIETKIKSKVKQGDAEQESSMTQSIDFSWVIDKVDDKGAAKVKMKFGRSKGTVEGPGAKFSFDTDDKKEPDDRQAKVLYQFHAALGTGEFTFTMQPTGEMSDLKVPAEVLKRLKEIDVGGPAFGEDQLRSMIEQGGIVLAKDPVAKGKDWTQKNVIKTQFGKMNVDMAFVYEGPETKDGAKLEKISIKLKMTQEPMPDNPIKLKDSKGEGTAYFDNAAGRIVEISQQQDVEFAGEINGVAVTQQMRQETVMRLKKSK